MNNRIKYKELLLMFFMIAASFAAVYLKPTHKIADDRTDFDINTKVPNSFSDWTVIDNGSQSIVNPQQAATIKRIYSQTLSRTYVNSKGQKIMLAIAYGKDQTDSTQVHYPEFCYPAQGFQILKSIRDSVDTPSGNIQVKKLIAQLGERVEPIIYWTTVGNIVVNGNKETKLAKLKYAFDNKIPDGLLYRVSTIDKNISDAYIIESKFIADMAGSLDSETLEALMGLKK